MSQSLSLTQLQRSKNRSDMLRQKFLQSYDRKKHQSVDNMPPLQIIIPAPEVKPKPASPTMNMRIFKKPRFMTT